MQAGNELVRQVKIYPLSKAANPPAQRLLDMTDVLYDGLVKYDETFFTSLARMLNEEPVQPRDLQIMGMLLPLGIEKGKEFKPDAATVAKLKEAAAEAQAWLMDKAATDVTPWWPDSQWCVPSPPITVPTEFKWQFPTYGGRSIAVFDKNGKPLTPPGGVFQRNPMVMANFNLLPMKRRARMSVCIWSPKAAEPQSAPSMANSV